MTTKKTGSLLGNIMRSREQAAAEPSVPPASIVTLQSADLSKTAPPTSKPVSPAASAGTVAMRLLEEGGDSKPEASTPAVPPQVPVGKGTPAPLVPSAPELKPHRVKKSYSIKASNVEALELLAWFMDKPDSQVVDQALDLLVQTMGKELDQAAGLKAARSGHRAAV
jgi:hypothetical protein